MVIIAIIIVIIIIITIPRCDVVGLGHGQLDMPAGESVPCLLSLSDLAKDKRAIRCMLYRWHLMQ